MRIIIAGAGAVGTHLAKLFSREQHDIVLMDDTASRLEGLGSDFDLMTVCTSPLSIAGLREAGAGRADLFIAVTPDEAHNMTSCMLASKLGARKTVARVDNEENTTAENQDFFRSVGIGSIIYPEMLAGREIMATIRRSWTRQWWEVHDGLLVMLGVKVRHGAPVLDIPLKDLCGRDTPYYVVAVKRGPDTLIPHGDDSLHHGDVVYFMTTPLYIPYVKEQAGKQDYPDVRDVIFMGGGDTTLQALHNLPDYMHAKVIEADEERCRQLSEMLDGRRHVLVIHGDGRDLELLQEEGIAGIQAFAALTGSAEANILACLAAKRLGVRKTVARVESSDYVSMAESLDIGSIINKKTFAAGHIYQMMLKADVTNVKCLTLAKADVAEFVVAEGAKVTRRPVRDLHLPDSVTLGGLVRGGRGFLINGATEIRPGDTVMAFCLDDTIKRLAGYFN